MTAPDTDLDKVKGSTIQEAIGEDKTEANDIDISIVLFICHSFGRRCDRQCLHARDVLCEPSGGLFGVVRPAGGKFMNLAMGGWVDRVEVVVRICMLWVVRLR